MQSVRQIVKASKTPPAAQRLRVGTCPSSEIVVSRLSIGVAALSSSGGSRKRKR